MNDKKYSTRKETIRPGDSVKYMSRKVLVTNVSDDWVYGIEFGTLSEGRYKKEVVKKEWSV